MDSVASAAVYREKSYGASVEAPHPWQNVDRPPEFRPASLLLNETVRARTMTPLPQNHDLRNIPIHTSITFAPDIHRKVLLVAFSIGGV